MIAKKIKDLAKKKNAVILSHYYQEDEIQDLADFVGDSLELSKKAANTDADVIVFCGVKFMAEVAKILSPEKKVLIPDKNAGCSLEDSCKVKDFKNFLSKSENNFVITYINSSVELKSVSDVVCTSSSAEKIINNAPKDKNIIFGPDKHLGAYLQKKTGRKMRIWQGTCVVHENFSEKHLVGLIATKKGAKVIAHPECPENLLNYADHIGSTSSLIKYVEGKKGSFIVLTEPGILYKMKQASPGSDFYPVNGIGQSGCESCSECPYMRLNTLEKLHDCILKSSNEILLEESIRISAKKSLDKMFDMLKVC